VEPSTKRKVAADTPVDALFTTLCADLCRPARREVRRSGAHTVLGTGTWGHEVWLVIGRETSLVFDSNGRFLAYAARTMRGLVIDRVRARCAQKRGGVHLITSLDTQNAEQIAQPAFSSGYDATSARPESQKNFRSTMCARSASSADSSSTAAPMKGVSERTVQRQWKRARLLLYEMLNEG
jgi:ECF sigma factor